MEENKLSEQAKELKKQYHKEWRQKNKEHLSEYQKTWRSENPDKVKAIETRYWENKVKQMQ